MYNVIKDPVTGLFVKTNNKRGKKILSEYWLYYQQQGGNKDLLEPTSIELNKAITEQNDNDFTNTKICNKDCVNLVAQKDQFNKMTPFQIGNYINKMHSNVNFFLSYMDFKFLQENNKLFSEYEIYKKFNKFEQGLKSVITEWKTVYYYFLSNDKDCKKYEEIIEGFTQEDNFAHIIQVSIDDYISILTESQKTYFNNLKEKILANINKVDFKNKKELGKKMSDNYDAMYASAITISKIIEKINGKWKNTDFAHIQGVHIHPLIQFIRIIYKSFFKDNDRLPSPIPLLMNKIKNYCIKYKIKYVHVCPYGSMEKNIKKAGFERLSKEFKKSYIPEAFYRLFDKNNTNPENFMGPAGKKFSSWSCYGFIGMGQSWIGDVKNINLSNFFELEPRELIALNAAKSARNRRGRLNKEKRDYNKRLEQYNKGLGIPLISPYQPYKPEFMKNLKGGKNKKKSRKRSRKKSRKIS